jgi:hypothetical protein
MVRQMTGVTAILMVGALVVGINGMNFDRIPELHSEYKYAGVLGLMLVLSVRLWAVFRRPSLVVGRPPAARPDACSARWQCSAARKRQCGRHQLLEQADFVIH